MFFGHHTFMCGSKDKSGCRASPTIKSTCLHTSDLAGELLKKHFELWPTKPI